jgi:hypothetical protein
MNLIKEKMNIKICVFLALLFGSSLSFAADGAVSLGELASNVFGIGMDVRSIIRFICIVAGVSLMLGSLLQYKKYRQNPVEMRLSTVMFTFIIGVCLILLSFIPIQVE